MAAKLKSNISSAFRMNGLTLRSEASKYLVEVILTVPENQRDEAVEKILEAVQKLPLKSTMIDQQICETAVEECNAHTSTTDNDKVFSVIDAFTVPQFVYRSDRKKFIPSSEMGISKPVLYPEAEGKADIYKNRYTLIHQRTCRHDLFAPIVAGSVVDPKSRKFQLKPVEYLLGSNDKIGDIIILGMLAQIKEGKWFLEDTTGVIQLDLSDANFHAGLFTENCFVLVEGWYEDNMFHVNAFGLPPPEPSHITRTFFGNLNFFGGPNATSVKFSDKLQQLEADNEDAMMILLSDVWLDSAKVMDKLYTLFSGYSEMPPTCFIFCGNFISSPGPKLRKQLKEGLLTLAKMLQEFKDLVEQSRFIFVPGPNDPGLSTILPRPGIPNTITEEFCRRVPTATFATNPCRIQYCTQEILVFREDIVTKMCRNCVRFPQDNEIPTHFAKTLLSQGHLCPLPLHISPVYWQFDHALQVYPIPDLVVCADKYNSFSISHMDCNIVNPGSFPKNGFSFKVYYPVNKSVEDSKIRTTAD